MTTGERVTHQEADNGSANCTGCKETWPCPDFAMATDDRPTPDTANEYLIGYGKNLPNHSESLRNRPGFLRQQVSGLPTFRTREAAYRYAAWLVSMAETMLPAEDPDNPHTFDEVLDAVKRA